jgi:hypothetical protein
VNRRSSLLAAALVLATIGVPAALATPPTPEPNFAATVLPRPCTPKHGDVQEAAWAEREGWQGPEFERYPGKCQRLRFSYGPFTVKPGQNDVLIEPIRIEKPAYDGYMTRFAPDLVRAEDGTVPPIEQVHLHHAVWITEPTYGEGTAFTFAGEEKTSFSLPRGYGLPVKGSDAWLILYMIHSAVPQPIEVYITYDVDYIPKATGDAMGLKPAYPIWMDVRPGFYPVFNVERGFGAGGTCTWPKQQCAKLDPYGKVVGGQGAPPDKVGTDLRLPSRGGALGRSTNFQGGTLIHIAGHLHPGGLTNDIDVVRGAQTRRIYTGEALYWDRTDQTRTGGPPTSWDFSQTVQALPYWGVHVQPGDVLRSNATYDTTVASVYEAMGIAVAYIAPDLPNGTPTAPGVDPFAAPTDSGPACPTGGLLASPQTVCNRGWMTHAHLHENDNYGGPAGTLAAARGQKTGNVAISGFTYLPGDLSMAATTGVPTVSLGTSLQFVNSDAGLNVYHTATSCQYPCTGPTGTSFPVPNGGTSLGRSLDFDSAQLGFGIPTVSAAKNAATWNLPVTAAAGYAPGEVVTYFCRIHPFMRGAFEVTQ